MLTGAERHQLLVEWNWTDRSYPRTALMHELFEAQAGRTPERTALKVETTVLSYAELDTHARRMAQALRSRGVAFSQTGALITILFGRLRANWKQFVWPAVETGTKGT